MRLNILHWPIWLKLTAGFITTLLLPLLLIMLVARDGFETIGLQNGETTVEERGIQISQQIATNLIQASAQLNAYATDQEFVTALLNQLAEKATDADLAFLKNQAQNIWKQTNLFNYWLLATLDGQAKYQLSDSAVIPTQNLYQLSVQALERFHNAETLGHSQAFAFEEPQQGAHVIQALQNAQGQTVALLVGQLNSDAAFYKPLSNTSAVYPIYSYLRVLDRRNIVYRPAKIQTQLAAVGINISAVRQVERGQSGVERFTLGENQSVITYFSPIINPINTDENLFALVTEISTASLTNSLLGGYFNGTRWFPITAGVLLILALLVIFFNQLITPSLAGLRQAIQSLGNGDYSVPVPSIQRKDEIGELSTAFVDMRTQVQNMVQVLENRVAARSRDISATQEISRYAATEQNLQTLLNQVVQLIIEQFPMIYHAQIFLLDSDGVYAVLRSSTGEVGQKLLARGHRLGVGSVSVIGQVTAQRQVVIARDTATSQIHRKNEFLPDTRAELAIPLLIGERLIGALDVQSRLRDAFSADEVTVLQTMAAQVAVAIENARLYQESVRRLADIERGNRQMTRRAWQDYVYGMRVGQLQAKAGLASAFRLDDLRKQALTTGQIVTGQVTTNNTIPVVVPLVLRGQTLGTVEWELPAKDYSSNKLLLAQELANRLAVNLDNARLFEESRRAAERERTVNAISAKLTPQTEISEILQTAVREVGQALRSPYVNIRLNPTSSSGMLENGQP